MAQPRQPFADELELGADGYIRDTSTGEIFGSIPIPFRSLYAAAPDLLAACEKLIWHFPDLEELLPGIPKNAAQLLQMARGAIAKAKGESK